MWVVGSGTAVVVGGGWGFGLVRSDEVVRSISVLGLVGVGGCGEWVVGSGIMGRVVMCVWGCVVVAVSVTWLGGLVQWRGGARAVISELGSTGGRRWRVVGVDGDWVRQYRWAGDGWYSVGCSVVWAAWLVGVVGGGGKGVRVGLVVRDFGTHGRVERW